MHIAINCLCFLKKHPTGIGRYASNLVRSLMELDRDNRYSLYVPRSPFDSKRSIPRLQTPDNFTIKLDWLKRGPGKTFKNLDIYHAPCPDVIRFNHTKVIVTIHDLVYRAFPEGHTQQTLEITDRQCRSFMTSAAKLICVSKSTAEDVKKFFGVPDEKLAVIYNGIDHNVFYSMSDSGREEAKEYIKRKGVEGPFILFIGTIEPRKNLKNLFEAFAILKGKKAFKGKLVIIGMDGWKSESLKGHVDRLGIASDLITLGYVSNDELRSFYNLAEAFAFPSFYEGFGYPIIEALSCGAAVVTSNRSSCPEVAQDAALTVDPENAQEIADALQRILGDPQLKKILIDKGLKRSREFNHLKVAQQTLNLYKEVHSGASGES